MLAILAGYVMPACTQDPSHIAGNITKDITVLQFNEFTLADPGTVLDVRTKAEVAKGAIPESVNIDFYSDTFVSDISKLDKSKPVYVYCAVGGRSSQAMDVLSKNGFTEVYNLKGGYNAWSTYK